MAALPDVLCWRCRPLIATIPEFREPVRLLMEKSPAACEKCTHRIKALVRKEAVGLIRAHCKRTKEPGMPSRLLLDSLAVVMGRRIHAHDVALAMRPVKPVVQRIGGRVGRGYRLTELKGIDSVDL